MITDGTFLLAIAALVVALISGILLWLLSRANHRLGGQLELLEQKVTRVELACQGQSEELHEVRSGGLGIANRVKALDSQVAQLDSQVKELENLDPQTRRYSQAARLVESGATVDELMSECELPRAEAELLLSLRK